MSSFDKYRCPYCHSEFEDGYGEWESKEFEDSTDVWCPECECMFRVFRSWITIYTAEEPKECAMCPGSKDSYFDDWECRINGCDHVREW